MTTTAHQRASVKVAQRIVPGKGNASIRFTVKGAEELVKLIAAALDAAKAEQWEVLEKCELYIKEQALYESHLSVCKAGCNRPMIHCPTGGSMEFQLVGLWNDARKAIQAIREGGQRKEK